MTTVATLEPARLAIPPGGEASCTLTVRNRTDIVEGYDFEVLGDAATWAQIDPPSVRVYPGSEASARITFRMPRTAPSGVTEIPFAIRVLPLERPGDVVVPEGVLHIGPTSELGGELLPETSKARRTARHDVAIDNYGNTPLRVTLQPSDPEEALKFRSNPEQLIVQPGEAAVAQLGIRHRKLLWRGRPAPRRFRLNLASPDAGPVALDGTAMQQPVLGAWLWKAALALLALALVAAGLWFAMVKPAVKSAAKDQVKTMAEAGELPSGGGGGAAGGGQASPSPSASTESPTPSPSAPAATTGGTTEQRWSTLVSISAGNGSTKTGKDVKRPAGTQTTLVSYLLVSAPQGDRGSLELWIDGTLIIPLSLENIRNFDTHPSPPIEVKKGQKLYFKLKCDTAGTGLAGQSSKVCRASVTISGFVLVAAPPA